MGELGIKTLKHPLYSPDLALCDFWLFPYLKDQIRGKHYESLDDIKVAVQQALANLHEEEFKDAFQKWTERMRKCIECGGEYFEKL